MAKATVRKTRRESEENYRRRFEHLSLSVVGNVVQSDGNYRWLESKELRIN